MPPLALTYANQGCGGTGGIKEIKSQVRSRNKDMKDLGEQVQKKSDYGGTLSVGQQPWSKQTEIEARLELTG